MFFIFIIYCFIIFLNFVQSILKFNHNVNYRIIIIIQYNQFKLIKNFMIIK